MATSFRSCAPPVLVCLAVIAHDQDRHRLAMKIFLSYCRVEVAETTLKLRLRQWLETKGAICFRSVLR